MSGLFGRSVSIKLGGGDGQSIDLSKLRCAFTVNDNYGPELTTLQMDVYNLSKSTRSRIDSEFTRIRVEAGYSSGSLKRKGVIFDGDIANAPSRSDGADTITSIYAGSGIVPWRFSNVNLSLGPGTPLKKIVSMLGSTLEGVAGVDVSAIGSETFPGPYHASGLTRDALNDLLGPGSNYLWTFQDGLFRVISRSSPKQKAPIAISVATGMVGSPSESRGNIQVKVLMHPAIKPRGLVTVKSKGPEVSESIVVLGSVRGALGVSGADGTTKLEVLTVAHDGDTYGNEWLTRVEAFNPNFKIR